jgi:hypothetical protein
MTHASAGFIEGDVLLPVAQRLPLPSQFVGVYSFL